MRGLGYFDDGKTALEIFRIVKITLINFHIFTTEHSKELIENDSDLTVNVPAMRHITAASTIE